MKEKKHMEFSEQRSEEQHDERSNLHNNSNIPPQTITFKYQKLLLWVPIIAALAFITIGIIHQTLKKDQKLYCYKSGFIPTSLKPPTPDTITTGNRELLLSTRYGFKIYVDLYDYGLAKEIAKSGSYQPTYVNLIGHVVKSQDVVLVVGSHFGLEAVVIGKIIGPNGKLHIFSPTQFLSNLHQKNILLNTLNHTTKIHKIQPSSFPHQSQTQVISSLNFSTTSSPTFDPTPIYTPQQIQHDKIDSILPTDTKLNFAYINMGKLAVQALMGMREVIRRSPGLVMIVRWEVGRIGEVGDGDRRELLDFLANQRYRAYTYKGGSYRQSCTVGEFLWQGDLQKLINIRQQMLVFLPEGYILPR